MRVASRPLASIIFVPSAVGAHAAQAEAFAAVSPVEWSRSANIDEVNIRQNTKEGTIKAFAGHLPREKRMGVDILWRMPVQPIDTKN